MKSLSTQLTSIEGMASDVRQARATIVSNGGFGAAWDNSLNNSYECLFRLSDAPVALRVGSPIFIDEGQTVRVDGRHNGNGVFEALAYHNRSSGVSGIADGVLFQSFFDKWIFVLAGFCVAVPFTLIFVSRFVRDDHWVANPIITACAFFVLPFMLVSWAMYERYRNEVRAIERLLNDKQPPARETRPTR
jgi:hypothetical protein